MSKKIVRMAQTLRLAVAVVLFMLVLQIASTAFYSAMNMENMALQREQIRNRFVEAVALYYANVENAVDQLRRHPVVVEFQYREGISYGNFEKRYRLINRLKELDTAHAGEFDIFIYFPRSDRLYDSEGEYTDARGARELLRAFGEIEMGEHFVKDAAFPSVEFGAHLVSYKTDMLQIVVACPRKALADIADSALLDTYALAEARNAEGDVIACSSALLMDAGAADAKLSEYYQFTEHQTKGMTVEIGLDRRAPNVQNARNNAYLVATTVICLISIAGFLWMFARKIYAPISQILTKLEMDIDGDPQAGGELLRIDAFVTGATERLRSLNRQMREHDDIIFENTLNKLAQELQVTPDNVAIPAAPSYVVLTLVCENASGALVIEGARRTESALRPAWRVRPFYRYDRQLSYHVELPTGGVSELIRDLRAMELGGHTAIALSSVKRDLRDLRRALEESREALMLGTDEEATASMRVCTYGEGYGAPLATVLGAHEESQLIHAALRGDEAFVEGCLSDIFAGHRLMPIAQMRELCAHLISLLGPSRLETQDGSCAYQDAARRIVEVYDTGVLSAIVIEQYRRAAESISKETEMFSALTDFIREHYRSPALSLQLAADHIGMSYSYLSKRFKQMAGTGFSDYLAAMRIEEAKRLLEETDVPIGDIAQMVGFDVLTSFSRAFKKHVGIPPIEHRRLFTRTPAPDGLLDGSASEV